MNKKSIITCPFCGREYLVGEIYMPTHFLGVPKNIEKSESGQILYYEGIEQDTTEKFTCEKCGNPFIVRAKITYDIEKIEIDKSEEYVVKKYKDRIYLDEKED